MYCEDYNNSEDIIKLINKLKIVKKNERGTFRNKDQKFGRVCL